MMQAGENNYMNRVDKVKAVCKQWIESHDDPMVGTKELLLYVIDIAAGKGVVIEHALLMTIKHLGIRILTSEERNQIRQFGVSSGIAKDFTTPALTETKCKRWEDNLEEIYMPNPDEGLRSVLQSKTKPNIIHGTASKAQTFINSQMPHMSATPDGIYDFYGVLCPIEFRRAKEFKKNTERSRDDDEGDCVDDDYSDQSAPTFKTNHSKEVKQSRYQRSLNNLTQPISSIKKKGPKQSSTRSQALEWKEGVPSVIINDKITQLKHQMYCLRAPFGLLMYRVKSIVHYQFIERDNHCVNLALERQNNFLDFKSKYQAQPIDIMYELSLYRDFNKNNCL